MFVLFVSLCAITSPACGGGEAKAKKLSDYAIPVAVEKVKIGTVRDVVSVTGNIMPDSMVTLFSNLPGAVTKVLVKEGDHVRKGQVVAYIDPEKAGLQAKQAKSALQMARVNLANMEANKKRLEVLYKEKAIPQKMMDDMNTAFFAAQSQTDQAESMVGLANSQLNDATIIATMDGVIAKKHIDQGEVVTSAQMMKVAPIVTIVDTEKVKVVLGIEEKDISRIRIGQNTEVRVDTWPERIFSGKVTNISPIVNPMNRLSDVEIIIDNKDGALKPGMFARINIIIDVHENAVVIPFDATVSAESGLHVFIAQGDKAVRKEIKKGFLDGTILEVTEGLKGGEELIVLGQQRLKDGVKVISQPIGGLK